MDNRVFRKDNLSVTLMLTFCHRFKKVILKPAFCHDAVCYLLSTLNFCKKLLYAENIRIRALDERYYFISDSSGRFLIHFVEEVGIETHYSYSLFMFSHILKLGTKAYMFSEQIPTRSEERRVGKESRARGDPEHDK